MAPVLRVPLSLLLCMAMWPLAAAAPLDLPERPGDFWLRMDELPMSGSNPVDAAPGARFASLAELTEHALRSRPQSRAAWLAIQAEAARLDAANAANWPTLTGQLALTRSRALSSLGTAAPTLDRLAPSLSLAYVLYDFGARAAGIEAQRYQLVASLLNGNRVLQDTIAEVESAYFARVAADAQVAAWTQQEAALQASLDAVEVRLASGLASRADLLRARAARVNPARNGCSIPAPAPWATTSVADGFSGRA